jgi:O-antigen/teichoic acid export membrane protein
MNAPASPTPPPAALRADAGALPAVAAAPLPPPGASLSRNVLTAVAGNVFFNACRFVLVVLIVKCTAAEVLGTFDAAMARSGPIITFCMLQLRGAYVADTRRSFSFGTYQALRALGMAVAAGALLVWVLARAGHEPAAFTVIFAGVCAGKVIWSLAEVYWGVFQQQDRMDRMALSIALRGVAMLLPFAVVLPVYAWLVQRGVLSASRLAESVAWATCGYAALWSVVLVAYDRRVVRTASDLDYGWDWARVWRLARHTAPLGVVVLIIAVCDSLPRLVISEQDVRGNELLGYFAGLNNVMLPVQLLVLALGQAAANRLARTFDQDAARFVRLTWQLSLATLALGLVTLVAVAVVGRAGLVWLYAPQYAAYQRELLIVAAGAVLLLLASLFGVISTATRFFWVQVPMQLAVLAVSGLVAWRLIPASPVSGGAWTYVARGGTQCVLYGLLVLGVVRASRKRSRDAAMKRPGN